MGALSPDTPQSETWRYVYGIDGKDLLITHIIAPDKTVTRLYYHFGTASLAAMRRGGVLYHVVTDQIGTPLAVFDETYTLVRELRYSELHREFKEGKPRARRLLSSMPWAVPFERRVNIFRELVAKEKDSLPNEQLPEHVRGHRVQA